MLKFIKGLIQAKRYKRLETIMSQQKNILKQEREELSRLDAVTEELKAAIQQGDAQKIFMVNHHWKSVNDDLDKIKLAYTVLELKRLKLKKKLA